MKSPQEKFLELVLLDAQKNKAEGLIFAMDAILMEDKSGYI